MKCNSIALLLFMPVIISQVCLNKKNYLLLMLSLTTWFRYVAVKNTANHLFSRCLLCVIIVSFHGLIQSLFFNIFGSLGVTGNNFQHVFF